MGRRPPGCGEGMRRGWYRVEIGHGAAAAYCDGITVSLTEPDDDIQQADNEGGG